MQYWGLRYALRPGRWEKIRQKDILATRQLWVAAINWTDSREEVTAQNENSGSKLSPYRCRENEYLKIEKERPLEINHIQLMRQYMHRNSLQPHSVSSSRSSFNLKRWTNASHELHPITLRLLCETFILASPLDLGTFFLDKKEAMRHNRGKRILDSIIETKQRV